MSTYLWAYNNVAQLLLNWIILYSTYYLLKLYEFAQLYVDFLACIFSGIIWLAEHWEQSESRGYQILEDLFSTHSITFYL